MEEINRRSGRTGKPHTERPHPSRLVNFTQHWAALSFILFYHSFPINSHPVEYRIFHESAMLNYRVSLKVTALFPPATASSLSCKILSYRPPCHPARQLCPFLPWLFRLAQSSNQTNSLTHQSSCCTVHTQTPPHAPILFFFQCYTPSPGGWQNEPPGRRHHWKWLLQLPGDRDGFGWIGWPVTDGWVQTERDRGWVGKTAYILCAT